MDLSNLVISADKYEITFVVNDLPVYSIRSATAIGRQLSQSVENLYAIGQKDPVATKKNAKNNTFNLTLQAGEGSLIIQAAQAAGFNVNDFRDLDNCSLICFDRQAGTVEQFVNCAFSQDNRSYERNALETLRELSGTFSEYKEGLKSLL